MNRSPTWAPRHDALVGLAHQAAADFIQPFQREVRAGLAIGAGFIRRHREPQPLAQALGLADGLAAGRPGLGHLPEKSPESQPQAPPAVAGMGSLVLGREPPSGDPAAKEGFALVEAQGELAAQLAHRAGQGGPRYQWSRRVAGKTVTVALSAEQFAWLKAVIANQRKVWATLEQMHQITLRHLWRNLPQTTRRKQLSKKTLGLN